MAKRTTSKKAGAGKAAKAPKKTAKASSKTRVVAPANRTTTKVTPVRKDKATKNQSATTKKNAKPSAAAASRGKREAPPAPKKPGKDGMLSKVATRIKAKPIKERKTRLSPEELEEFRQMLLAKRSELVGDVNHLEDEAIRAGGHGGGGPSAMPIHMADLGSDTWEQELTLGLIANERTLLREIDEALDRIDNKTYGICLATGKVITKARLRAQPWAKYCIEYARKRELGLV